MASPIAAFGQGVEIGDALRRRRATAQFFQRFGELTAEDPEPALTPAAIPAGAPPPVAAEPAIPPPTPAATPAPPRRSLTQDNIRELDRLALTAARETGSAEVYDALRKTTDSFLQGKFLRNIGLAQAAMQGGDIDAVERHLRAAYRFIPDGQEAPITRRDGKLFTKDLEGKDAELTSQAISDIALITTDPLRWSQIVREDQARAAEAKHKEAEHALEGRRVDAIIKQVGLQERETILKENTARLENLMAPIERMATFERGLYFRALAGQARQVPDAKMPEFLDESRQMGEAVNNAVDALVLPPQPAAGAGPLLDTWTPPAEIMVTGPDGAPRPMDTTEINHVRGLAQTIAMENRGVIGTNVAVSAALLLVKSQLDPARFTAQINLDTGVMMVPLQGLSVPVRLPPDMVRALAAQQAPAPLPPQHAPYAVPPVVWPPQPQLR